MAYISCDCKSKVSFYPFIMPFITMILRFLYDRIIEEATNEKHTFKILKYDLPYLIYLNFPKLLSVFIILIIKFNSKRESTSLLRSMTSKTYHSIAKIENKKKFFLLIFIISFLEILGYVGDHLLYYYQKINMSSENEHYRLGWLIEKKSAYIIFVPIFCCLLLNSEIHNHHILSLILGFIGSFIINIVRFIFGFSKIDKYLFHLANIILSSISSLVIVLTKCIMSKYLIKSPYIFLFYDGVFCIINSLIITLLVYPLIINIPDYNINIDIDEENKKYFSNNYFGIVTFLLNKNYLFYIYFFLSFFLSFVYYIINALTIYNHSPYLLILLDAFLPIDDDLIFILLGRAEFWMKIPETIKRNIFQSFGYALLFFAALILNEIIILNFCGFNENINRNIILRSNNDSNALELSSENESESETSNITDEEYDTIVYSKSRGIISIA